jgi:uncharacterized membrane protein YgdD (TMEM256/DUF423 family)
MTERHFIIIAALNMIVAVGAGAFGAHGLKQVLSPELLAVWHTGVLYHLIHAIGLFIVALLAAKYGGGLFSAAGLLMFVGIILFSGSLYILALTGTRWLGAVTPLGGVAFILAWALVAWAAWRSA